MKHKNKSLTTWSNKYNESPIGDQKDFFRGFGHYYMSLGKKRIHLKDSNKYGLAGLLAGKVSILVGSACLIGFLGFQGLKDNFKTNNKDYTPEISTLEKKTSYINSESN